MTKAQISAAVETINRVERNMINAMTQGEYREYMAIPEEARKAMLYAAYKIAA